MASQLPTQVPGDKLKKAIVAFSEIIQDNPGKSRAAALQEVEMKFDLSPLECQFLDNHFKKAKEE